MPIDERVAKKCGLEDDNLSRKAKHYFYESSDKASRANALESATDEQKKVLAQQLRDTGQRGLGDMDDGSLIALLKATHTSNTCEITACTVPCPSNNQRAVSFYSADDAEIRNLPYNRRATEILVGCGHNVNKPTNTKSISIGAAPSGGIRGDCFVGRCHDDEKEDIWERVDFILEDADSRAEWCQTAKERGGGGGGGHGHAESLSGFVNQNTFNSLTEGQADGYTWSQNSQEVELRFLVADGTRGRSVKVNFSTRKFNVAVEGETLLEGELGGSIDTDGCTFTIEDATGGSGKELVVTLCKKHGATWPFVIR